MGSTSKLSSNQCLGLSSVLFPLRFPGQDLACIPTLSHTCFIPLCFILTVLGEEYKLRSSITHVTGQLHRVEKQIKNITISHTDFRNSFPHTYTRANTHKQVHMCTCTTHEHTWTYSKTCLQQNQKVSQKSLPYALQSYQTQHIFNLSSFFPSYFFSSSLVNQCAHHSLMFGASFLPHIWQNCLFSYKFQEAHKKK